MMKFLVFGGGGQVARHFARHAVEGKHQVIAVLRNDNHSKDLTGIGAEPVVFSMEQADTKEIASFISSHAPDCTIFAAGAGGKDGPERTRAVDYDGACKVFSACEEAGFKRLLLVSAVDVRDRDKPAPSYYNAASLEGSDRVWKALGSYMQAKYDAEVALHLTSLDFTVLRPGRLTNEPAGNVDLGVTQLGAVSRELVGKVLLACALEPRTVGLTLDVMDGKDTIWEAVEKCANDRADAWTG